MLENIMKLDRKGYKTGSIFNVTSCKKTKSIFAITKVDKPTAKKRHLPFLVQHNSMGINSSTEEFANRVPVKIIEKSPTSVFSIAKQVPNKSNHTKQTLPANNQRENQPIEIATNKLREEFKVSNNNFCGVTSNESNFIEMRLASIFGELQSVSQELANDYLTCKHFATFDPSLLHYWTNLQSCVSTLNHVAQDIIQGSKLNVHTNRLRENN